MKFDEMGFRFQYPDNWTVTREPSRDYPRSVTVQNPQGSFWSVTADRLTPDALIEQMVGVLKNDYEGLEQEPIERVIGEHQLTGVELYFYCLDLVIIAQILCASRSGVTWAVMTQAESRQHEELSAVFDAMTFSLLQA